MMLEHCSTTVSPNYGTLKKRTDTVVKCIISDIILYVFICPFPIALQKIKSWNLKNEMMNIQNTHIWQFTILLFDMF